MPKVAISPLSRYPALCATCGFFRESCVVLTTARLCNMLATIAGKSKPLQRPGFIVRSCTMTIDQCCLRTQSSIGAADERQSAFNQGTSGNISARLWWHHAVMPSATPYESATSPTIAGDADRSEVAQLLRLLAPSSEWRFHLDIMKHAQWHPPQLTPPIPRCWRSRERRFRPSWPSVAPTIALPITQDLEVRECREHALKALELLLGSPTTA